MMVVCKHTFSWAQLNNASLEIVYQTNLGTSAPIAGCAFNPIVHFPFDTGGQENTTQLTRVESNL